LHFNFKNSKLIPQSSKKYKTTWVRCQFHLSFEKNLLKVFEEVKPPQINYQLLKWVFYEPPTLSWTCFLIIYIGLCNNWSITTVTKILYGRRWSMKHPTRECNKGMACIHLIMYVVIQNCNNIMNSIIQWFQPLGNGELITKYSLKQ